MKEQIKEIAKILTEAAHMACEDIPFAPPNDYDPCNLKVECHRCKEARALIAAGYRKQNQGKWIDKEYFGIEVPVCSVCEYESEHYEYHAYCPNCGAKMKGSVE